MTEEKTESKGRLLSLDVFRGATIAAMILVNNPGDWGHVYAPLLHAEWHGWTFTDTIFPFFLFIVGVAIVFAFSKKLSAETPVKDIYMKILRRTLILFGLGLFLSAFPFFNFSVLRIPGVLQRIAVCYLIASVIFLNTSWKGQLAWGIGLLLAYWGIMAWIPVPDIGAGLYEKGANFSNYLDSIILKGHMWSHTKTWDPEGIVSTLPAVSTTLFGVLTGHWLKSNKTPLEKTTGMLVYGNIILFAGLFWSSWLPINKSIWTSSYSVTMAGLALICLGICYYFIDVRGMRRGIQPALVYGLNAITVFVLSGIIGKLLYLITYTTADGEQATIGNWIYHTFFSSWLSDYNASLAYAVIFIIFMYLLMLILYKKKIYIKI